MAVTLARFRAYGAINAEETDTELQGWIDAAKEALTIAGVAERANSSLYDLAVMAQALDYHDNRGAAPGDESGISWRVQSMIHQLRNTAPAPGGVGG